MLPMAAYSLPCFVHRRQGHHRSTSPLLLPAGSSSLLLHPCWSTLSGFFSRSPRLPLQQPTDPSTIASEISNLSVFHPIDREHLLDRYAASCTVPCDVTTVASSPTTSQLVAMWRRPIHPHDIILGPVNICTATHAILSAYTC